LDKLISFYPAAHKNERQLGITELNVINGDKPLYAPTILSIVLKNSKRSTTV